MTARSSRKRASAAARGHRRCAALGLAFVDAVAATHDDRVDVEVEAGLAEGDDVRVRAEEARPAMVQPAPAKARSSSVAGLCGSGHQHRARRRVR